jgi:hypothetical protein
VAPKKSADVVPQDNQLIALGKRIHEVEEVIEKDSSSSSQRKRPSNVNLYDTAAKFVDFAELCKSPKASKVVATHTGDPFCKAISKLGVKYLELLQRRLWCVPVTGAPTATWYGTKSTASNSPNNSTLIRRSSAYRARESSLRRRNISAT